MVCVEHGHEQSEAVLTGPKASADQRHDDKEIEISCE